jgi:hypothetical protein
MDGTIPSTIADSGAKSEVGNEDDPSHHTGEPSDKRFILPSGKVIQATEKSEYPFNVREQPTKSTSPPESVNTRYSARGNTQMPTTSQCLTRILSTTTTPMTPSSP